MRALPRGNNRSREAAVEQRFPTARSLATIYVASIGIKRVTCVHCQEATIVVEAAVEQRFRARSPATIYVASTDIKESQACIAKGQQS